MDQDQTIEAPRRNPGGRPTTYSPTVAAEILQNIVDGMPLAAAARFAGVPASVFFDWKKRYPEFSEQVRNAKGKRVRTLLKRADEVSYKHPGTIFRLLEMADPAFAPPATNVNLRVSGNVQHNHQHTFQPIPNPHAYLQQVVTMLDTPQLEEPSIDADFSEQGTEPDLEQ